VRNTIKMKSKPWKGAGPRAREKKGGILENNPARNTTTHDDGLIPASREDEEAGKRDDRQDIFREKIGAQCDIKKKKIQSWKRKGR